MIIETYIGEIRAFTGNFAPDGWMVCDGTLLSASQYRDLFSVVGTTYGGDGKPYFALPDMRGRVMMGWGQGAGLTGREIGAKDGVTTVKLSPAQMPEHTHLPGASPTADLETPLGTIWGNPGLQRPQAKFFATEIGNKIPLAAGAVSIEGGDAAHTNMMPYQALLFCIAVVGGRP